MDEPTLERQEKVLLGRALDVVLIALSASSGSLADRVLLLNRIFCS